MKTLPLWITLLVCVPACTNDGPTRPASGRAKNVIFFVGDGMGVSTVTATRIFSVGLDGKLAMDTLPFTAVSKTYTTDHITPDSAGTMTAMVTGQNTNSGILGLDATTEPRDFNGDGDGKRLTTILEIAKAAGKRVGLVSTARVTHATPGACYAKTNDRDEEDAIALQATPGDPTYNPKLGAGIDLLAGGGRRHFVPKGVTDEEGSAGHRKDGRDLRAEWQAAGYHYCWNTAGWDAIEETPVLALFESTHMEYEFDRPKDAGGEPALADMVRKSIDLLAKDHEQGFFLMVEGGRIDHAHHAGNAWRALHDTEEFDEAIAAAIEECDLTETLIVVTADHSHVFTIAGYPLRQKSELPYAVKDVPAKFEAPHHGIFHTVFGVDPKTGEVSEVEDSKGTPYTVLGYGNGPGYRGKRRVAPSKDRSRGFGKAKPSGPNDPAYRQEAAIPLKSETHGGEDVVIWAIGAGASRVRGTVKNTFCFDLMREAMRH